MNNQKKSLNTIGIPSGRTVKRFALGLTALFSTLIAATLLSTGLLLYQAGIKDWSTDLAILGNALSESVAQSISSARLVLDSMQADIENLSIQNATQLQERLATKQYSLSLKEKISSLPFISGVGVSNAEGRVVVLSRTFPTPAIDMSDRDYFGHHSRSQSTEDYIGRTINARSNGQPTFFLTRRVNDKNGHLLAILVVGLRHSFFERFFKSLAYSKPYSVLLSRDDQSPLVITNGDEELASHPGFIPLSSFQPKAVDMAGKNIPISFKDQGWLGFYHPIRDSSLYLEIAVTSDVYLSEWLASMYPVMIVAAITLIALACVFFFIITLARQHENDAVLAKQLKSAADLANEAKSRFLAFVSHEVRTPMNGVLGLSELLVQSDLPDQSKKYAESILGASTSLVNIVNDILDFSKIEAGEMKLENIAFSPVKIVRETIELFRPLVERKSLRFDEDINCPRNLQLLGDPSRLKQVIVNLISNAVKFTYRGSITLRMKVMKTDGERWHLSIIVRDTGIGIAPDSMDRLFVPFTQANSAINRQFGGTGLGLAITKQLLVQMGGEIQCESQEGCFTQFSISVHLLQSESRSEEMGVDDRSNVSADLIQKWEGANILIADDTAINRQLLRILLQARGCSLTEVENGEQAVEAAISTKYDAILMDCMMPIMDGYQATQRIRQIEKEAGTDRTPIIALTASVSDEDRQRCIAAGMDDYLGKPFTQAALFSCLQKWIKAGD